jgi:hypothetical protein
MTIVASVAANRAAGERKAAYRDSVPNSCLSAVSNKGVAIGIAERANIAANQSGTVEPPPQ